MKKKIFTTIFLTASLVLVFIMFRKINCPEMLPMESTAFSDKEIELVRDAIDSKIISMETMADKVKNKKVILVGEIHFREKIMQCFIDFLDVLPVDKLVLALELPASIQPEINMFMENGDNNYLEKIETCKNCLPYKGIIQWCYEHKTKIKAIVAIDENRARIILNRALCKDTRNKTMTDNIIKLQRKNEEIPVVFYGGQLHCLQSGRYLYDVENRIPMGNRLLKVYSQKDLTTIILSANKHFVSYEAWGTKIGGLSMEDETTKILDRRYFIHEPVIGSRNSGDFFNYFVNIGDL